MSPYLASQPHSGMAQKKAAPPGAQCYLVSAANQNRCSHSSQEILLTLHLSRLRLMELVQGLHWLRRQPAHERTQEDGAVISSPETEDALSEPYSPG